MIREIRIKNYKSIQKLKLDLGQLTVLIGENGSGKSNILEAIAFGSAGANNKLDNEFLVSRGIRVTDPQFMRSAFDRKNIDKNISMYFKGDNDVSLICELNNDNKPYSKWAMEYEGLFSYLLSKYLIRSIKKEQDNSNVDMKKIIKELSNKLSETGSKLNLIKFIIYSPENHSLRIFEKEGQIEPLGINGEGLFKLLKVLSFDENIERLNIIKEKLRFIGWFEDFDIPKQFSESEKLIRIKDKYLDQNVAYFDQKSSNEGFLFLLFYFALFVSADTPDFFAIDNIDASLNPKLCSHLVKELADLAKKFGKQVILTTHNPAVLDGLNLDDPEQKLFVVFRNKSGHTSVKQVLKPKTPQGQEPVRLSEAFLRGYIGGLPKGF